MRRLRSKTERTVLRSPALSSLGLRSAAYAMLACAALLGLEGWNIWTDHGTRLRDITTVTSNMARSLAQHTDDMLDRADTVLAELVERVGADGTGPAALARLDALLQREALRPPAATAFFVYDAQGRWLASSVRRTSDALNNVDRDYFRHHQDSTDPQPYVGPLIRSRSRGTWIVTLSRRLQTADGRFAGVVLATIDAEYLARFFASFDLGQNGAAALFRADGLLLARQPFIESQAGRSYAEQPLFRTWLPEADAGTYPIVSPFDNVARWNSYRRAGRYPLVIAAAISEQEALAPWYREVAVRLSVAGVLASLLGILGLRLARQAQSRHQAERALAISEANFRLLAENSSDMVTRIGLDGRHSYASPAAERLLGRSPAEVLGKLADEHVHEADKAMIHAVMATLRAGEVEETTVTYRAHRADGQELWLESAVRITYEPSSGTMNGVVAVTRDVTGRHQMEEQLKALATQDGLTGLANRRAFDAALETEWRRALRKQEPICLALLDVDRFKIFNDTYGHQHGDLCLKVVAEVVQSMARRPADLAARYGGEELALLLPNTTAVGAMELAEKLRSALEEKRMAHRGNPPSGVVTASIGVAGITPDRQLCFGPEALIAAADDALYAAKHKGRNRVMLAATVPPLAKAAPEPADEAGRLMILQRYAAAGALQAGDPELDRLTRLATRLFNTPMALISVVEQERQVLVSRFGLDATETPREVSFCAHGLDPESEILVVPDAAADPRFAANPFVVGAPGVRFYAGAPLIVPGTEHRLGMFCIVDRTPRAGLDLLQAEVLRDLAALAVARMEQHRLLSAKQSQEGDSRKL
jgi:diguanylate cyclase (GGDEF)-like protein/PAS domain S-box-containing protein